MTDRICTVDGCDHPLRSMGLCEKHRKRYRRHGDPTVLLVAPPSGPLSETVCERCGAAFMPTSRPSRNRPAQRFCSRKCGILQGRRIKPPTWCIVPRCGGQVNAQSYCLDHYMRWRRYGDPLGKRIHKPRRTSSGYVEMYVPELGKVVLEHRWVMAQTIGRLLLPRENVHHVNGVRHDNRPENLELWVRTQPTGQRVEDLVAWVVDCYSDLVAKQLDLQHGMART